MRNRSTWAWTVVAVSLILAACSSSRDRPPPCTNCSGVGGSGAGSSSGGGGGQTGGAAGTTGGSGGGAACTGWGGAPMVEVTGPADEKFCIDVREATNEEYIAFQEAVGDPAQGAPCDFNSSFGASHAANDPQQPAFELDWCDALAFCTFVGKRLCGRMDGQAVAFTSEFNDPAKSEWHYVCTNGGTTLYPWGPAYQEGTCNGHTTANPVAEVMSYADCHGTTPPYDSVFDMAGNIAEWTNDCETTNMDGTDQCILRGGSYFSAPAIDQLKCGSDLETSPRAQANTDFGVRCCKSL